ncbi:MAG: TRAP transporter small permease subunit [Gammaproteobacteria bacterium]|nr:TRAP transporter small permease subunit [Gammaproteobacteria bacterium]
MSGASELSPGARMLARIDEGFFKFEKFLNLTAALVILGVMLIGVFQVVGRKLFNFPVPGYVDVIEMVMTIFAFLSISYTQRLGGHVRMEIILGRLKGRVLYFLEVMGTALAIGIVVVLLYFGYEHFLRAWHIGDSTIDIEIPIWPSKLLVPIAFSFLVIRLAIQLFGFVRLLLDPQAEPIGVPRIESVDEQAQHEIDAGLAGEEEKVDLPRQDQGTPR